MTFKICGGDFLTGRAALDVQTEIASRLRTDRFTVFDRLLDFASRFMFAVCVSLDIRILFTI